MMGAENDPAIAIASVVAQANVGEIKREKSREKYLK
jgi:hypothetical protein